MTQDLMGCERQRPMGAPWVDAPLNVTTLETDDRSRAARRIFCQPSTI